MATAKYIILVKNPNIELINNYLLKESILDDFKNKGIIVDVSDETLNLEYSYNFIKNKKHIKDVFFENYYNLNSRYLGIFFYVSSNLNIRNYLIDFCEDLSKEIDSNIYLSETNINECLFFPGSTT